MIITKTPCIMYQMATGGDSSDSHPVVLRVKRKREEDPAEALMITKHAKIDHLGTIDTSVFHFAGTVLSPAVSEKQILEKVKDHSKLSKPNPLARLSLADAQEQRRERKKVSSSNHRYKIVSQSRSLPEDSDEQLSSASKKSAISPQDSELLKLSIYDIENELVSSHGNSNSSGAKDVNSHTSSLLSTTDDVKENGAVLESEITCNSTRLIRERKDPKDTEFVYDLYYTHDFGRQRVSSLDWSTMTIRDCGVELVHDILDPDDVYCVDDDEDSNDESNWRNDYPDEDDLSLSGSHSNSEGEEYRYKEAFFDDDYSFHNDLDHGDLFQ